MVEMLIVKLKRQDRTPKYRYVCRCGKKFLWEVGLRHHQIAYGHREEDDFF